MQLDAPTYTRVHELIRFTYKTPLNVYNDDDGNVYFNIANIANTMPTNTKKQLFLSSSHVYAITCICNNVKHRMLTEGAIKMILYNTDKQSYHQLCDIIIPHSIKIILRREIDVHRKDIAALKKQISILHRSFDARVQEIIAQSHRDEHENEHLAGELISKCH